MSPRQELAEFVVALPGFALLERDVRCATGFGHGARHHRDLARSSVLGRWQAKRGPTPYGRC